MMTPVSILSLATAVPPIVIEQDEVAAVAPAVFADVFARNPALRDIFRNSGIARRHAVKPIEWYLAPRDWSDRSAVFLNEGLALFETAAAAALERAGVAARDIDLVVTVSSTGIATPTLEARGLSRLKFRSDVRRVPIFGLGCAGGVSGLATAARLARAEPGSTVLMVVLEICTLAFRADRGLKQDAVATALFGDGAAALVLRADADDGLAQVHGAAEHIWADTLDIMGWTVDPVGFGVVLSRSLPAFVENHLPAAAAELLAGAGIARPDVARFVCHPGGGRVIDTIETALGLSHGSFGDERAVLQDHGNMSSPTILFVLERVLRAPPAGTLALIALGPGFTASLAVLTTSHA